MLPLREQESAPRRSSLLLRTISECVPWRARRYCSWAKGAPAQMLRVNSALRDMSPADAACHRAWHETIAWATSSDASQSATTIRGMARRARATPGPGSSGAGRRASVTQTDALSPPRSRSIGTPSAWRRIGGVLFPPCSHPGGAEFGMVPWIWLCRAFSRARPTGFEPVTFGSVDRRGRARFGSTKPNSGSQVAKKSPEIQNRGHYPPRRAVWLAVRRGTLTPTASGHTIRLTSGT
jgi:hypothetical protein